MKLEELIDLYGDDILRLCIAYLGDRQLAEDAFQETFLKVWRSSEHFRGESSLKTWIATIAVNTCRDMLRSGWFRLLRKSCPYETMLYLPANSRPSTDGFIRTAVLNLAGMYREVIVLYYFQGMTITEIAHVLHLSQNTVATRLRRARKQLKNALKGEIKL